jgi:hypothetical protein
MSRQLVDPSALAPPGFDRGALFGPVRDPASGDGGARTSASEALASKRAWEIAKAPGSGMFMTLFMLYMSGSGVHIMSIIFTVMAFQKPLAALLSLQAAFASFDERLDLSTQKLAYAALNVAGLAVAVGQCYRMGLLPTSPAEWASLAWAPARAAAAGSGAVIG